MDERPTQSSNGVSQPEVPDGVSEAPEPLLCERDQLAVTPHAQSNPSGRSFLKQAPVKRYAARATLPGIGRTIDQVRYPVREFRSVTVP